MMQRTLILTTVFPPDVGGGERYLANLAKNLNPEKIIVVAPPRPGSEVVDAAMPVRIIRRDLHAARWLRPSWLAHLPWLLRTVRQERVQRILFVPYAGFVFLGVLLKIITKIPYVVTVFGLDFTAYRQTGFRRYLLRQSLQRAEWILTISSFSADLLKKFGVPSSKILLAPPGLEPAQPATTTELAEFKRQHNPDNSPVLLTVSRLVKRKGHARVLRALPHIIPAIPKLQYLIVGTGVYQENLERLVRSLGIASHVRFLGKLSDREIQVALAEADAFIMTPVPDSRDIEGFGMVYTEALAAGTPIIAPAIGGVRDIIQNNLNGLVLDDVGTPEDDARIIIRLLTDADLQKKLGAAGQNLVREKFSMDKQLLPYRIILDDLQDPVQAPLVSVVIPAWNAAETIAATLHNIEKQTLKNLEILVVNDGSTDLTKTIVKKFPNVQLIESAHAGAPAARNLGREQARGEFIFFCDADVALHPRILERLVTALRATPSASYAYCNFRFGWRTFDLFDFDPERLRKANYISMMSLIRRSNCPRFDESLQRLQDWDLWLTMLEAGKTGTWVPERLFTAKTARQGISQRISAPPQTAVEIIKKKHKLD